MFITRLEMTGFKSFAGRTHLEFRPGVMAVVGPNGCGKTNIVDAVRWVLGEQRTSALRADRMESVIFNGTSRRRPLGMAEVTLTIDNNRDVLPSEYAEVEITRRLFRSGESEYLINRQPSRLRDIHDLFADTGFTSNAYSIMELAMVDNIIAGPSEARRMLFEEAAGIAKYKARRTAAERRLSDTRENLQRIADIYAEVEKTFTTLKRQANKARRYDALTKAVRYRLIAHLAEERLDLKFRKAPLDKRLAELESEHEQAESDGAEATSLLLSLEGRELSLIDQNNRTQDALKRIDRREAEQEGESALVKQRIAYLEGDLAVAGERETALNAELQEIGASLQANEAELADIETRLKASEGERKAREAGVAQAVKAVEELRVKLAEARRELSEDEQRFSAADSKLEYSDAARRQVEKRLTELDGELTAAQKQLVELEASRAEAEKSLTDAAAQVKKLSQSIKTAESHRDQTASALEIARADLQQARTAHDSGASALQVHRARRPASPNPAALKAAGAEGSLNLGSRLNCDPQYKAALTAALDRLLEVFDAASQEKALQAAGKITEGGRLMLRFPGVRDSLAKPTPLKPPKSAGDAVLGADLVTGDDALGDFIRDRLADVVVVPDLQAAEKLSEWAQSSGARLVTMKGEIVEPYGVLVAGSIDPEAFAVGWEKRESELSVAFEHAKTSLDKATAVHRQSQSDADKAAQEVRTVADALRKAEDQRLAAERALSGLNDDLIRTRSRVEATQKDIDTLKSRLLPRKKGDDADKELEKLRAAFDIAKKQVENLESELTKKESERIAALESGAAAAGADAQLTEKRRALGEDHSRLQADRSRAEQAIADLKSKSARNAEELARVRKAAENLEVQRDLLTREKNDVTRTLEKVKADMGELRRKRDEMTARLDQAQRFQKELYSERSKVESESVSLRERLNEIDRRLIEDADFRPETVSETTVQDMLVKLEELDMAEEPLEKLKARLQSIGPVNMLALEELQEVEQRYRFLADQKTDLDNGISVLEETIDRVNSEARRVFREAFRIIDDNFQDTFRMLFEGGEARLALDDGDPLEADIRVWATPSGKKLQVLSMLSGGEKALTAIALLFAIYRARPSPFCVLDEIDAPLDDANVRRFNRLVAQFAVDTQFLIVTHNKRTMEEASCLFGVTLADDGTSRLVSVKLEDLETNEKPEKREMEKVAAG